MIIGAVWACLRVDISSICVGISPLISTRSGKTKTLMPKNWNKAETHKIDYQSRHLLNQPFRPEVNVAGASVPVRQSHENIGVEFSML